MSELGVWAQWLVEAVARTTQERFCHPTATYRLQFEKGKMTFRPIWTRLAAASGSCSWAVSSRSPAP